MSRYDHKIETSLDGIVISGWSSESADWKIRRLTAIKYFFQDAVTLRIAQTGMRFHERIVYRRRGRVNLWRQNKDLLHGRRLYLQLSRRSDLLEALKRYGGFTAIKYLPPPRLNPFMSLRFDRTAIKRLNKCRAEDICPGGAKIREKQIMRL